MPKIFISYRRADSAAHIGRIYDRLSSIFGYRNVFRDVINIPPGRDFRGVIREAIGKFDVILVVIGPDWLTVKDTNGNRRLDNPNDFVRLEVQTGLERDNALVIPVLVSGVSMPRASDLPSVLEQLAFKNAIIVRDDPDFDSDINKLVRAIGRNRKSPVILALLLVAFLMVGMGVLLSSKNDESKPTQVAKATTITATYKEQLIYVTPTSTSTSPPTQTVTPTVTASPSSTPTATSGTLELQNTQVSTSTKAEVSFITPTALIFASQVVAGFPCNAQIVSRSPSTTMLNVVRAGPSNYSTQRPSIRQGTAIILIMNEIDGNNTWYLANDTGGNEIGWILSTYLVLSVYCLG